MMVKCNDDEKPLTREEALDIAMSKVIYYDAHGGLEVSIPFDEGVEWQKSQPCPSCQEKDKQIAALKAKLKVAVGGLESIAYGVHETNSEEWAIAKAVLKEMGGE